MLRSLIPLLIAAVCPWMAAAGPTSRPAAGGDARTPLTTIVRLTSNTDRQLLQRIRGQTSDIAVRLHAVETGPLEPSLKAQLATADRLATSKAASSVVWFDAGRGSVVVHVAESPEGMLLIRTVELGQGKISAMLEAAAMMVRTALRAQVLGTPLGKDRSVVLGGAPAPQPRLATAPESPPGRRRGSPHTWLIGAGWLVGIDGQTATGLHGPFLSAECVLFGIGYVGITASFAIPAQIEDQLATISLSRHLYAATGGVRIALRHGFDLAAGLQLGAAFFRRTTEPAAQWVEATDPSWNPSLLLVAEAGLGWTWRRTIRFGLGVGVDVVPHAPVFAYEGADDLPTHGLWQFQPRISLSVRLVLQ